MATKKKPTESTNSEKDAISASGFEDSLQKLELIVKQMEQGELTLEQSLSHFEEGVNLTKNCQQALENAELRVQQLTNASGLTTTGEFDEQSHP